MSELLLEAMDEKSPLLDKVQKDLFNERVIYLNEDISGYTIDNIVPLIKHINVQDNKKNIKPEERKPIELHITSAGGSAYDGFSVLSEIENSITPVHTYCTGYAMSMGLPLFLAGHKRFMGKYATLLYHELRGGANGTRQEVKRLDKEYDRLQKVYDDYIINHSSVTQEVLDDHQEKVSDWYIDAKIAKKYGMYDVLI
ncbi:ClpP family protease [Bacillus sp. FJAT-22090]|uniref:ClpP family protease n=1 Tax=Bacillus sp. FJAT-22090 TaxID=1581038 RepID=UPI0011A971AD|nr:ATP-dependent Clp protease proteolytic subunit [Bacillus sp. FJAT-22090]